MKHSSKVVKIAVLMLSVGVAGGCASTSDLQRVESIANEARAMAERNGQTADEAKTMASQAMQAAQDAQACCRENSEKMDRVFRKSMYK